MSEETPQPKIETKPKVEETKPNEDRKKPIVCIVMGMAGSGKTTFMQRVNAHVHQHKIPSYFINLDPAVQDLPYGVNIDIRDTVKYKQVMKQYSLGPNGAIMTSLNLFATRFDQVIQYIEKKEGIEYVFIDTPGQIEIFTWSASGQIISELLASTFPTVIVYIIDTPRNTSPVTFMSNMMYACSILYKTKLPFIVAFNKIDIIKHDFAVKWMTDFEEFQDALLNEKTYSSSLASSMSLVLDEFYENLNSVGVSAVTGEGVEEFFKFLQKGAKEYEENYLPELERRKKKLEELKKKKQEEDRKRLQRDLEESKKGSVVLDLGKEKKKRQDDEEEEDEFDEEQENRDLEEFLQSLDELNVK